MKIEQGKVQYQPITITLETQEEATAFLEILDRPSLMTDAANRLERNLSNAFTNLDIVVP